ncbi:hypothetical protein [Desulfatitalea tepidiphila]|uniref:hypothetical protein n=1 Tax=Desulfatitalea tepidiphila TaxID=1185843 RepID=UPI0006B60217|nr:hypothetical protein [Desulfatitalea tepidiphila]
MKTAPLKSNLAQPDPVKTDLPKTDPPKTDPQKTDPWIGSVLWGRIGGTALVLTAFILQGRGIEFGPDDQQAAFGAVESVLAAAGVLMAIVSKYRQKAKAKKTGQAGAIALPLVLALLVAGAVALSFCGCAPNQTATSQIMSETSHPHAIAKAVYLDARTWYNQAQQGFIDSQASLAIDQRRRFNALLDDVGRALDLWGATLALSRVDTFEREAFRKAKNQLIDAGFVLLTQN